MKDFPKTKLLTDTFASTLEALPNMTVEDAFKLGAGLAATTVYKALEDGKLLALAAIAAILIEAHETSDKMESHATH
jgi:hypothetical protein